MPSAASRRDGRLWRLVAGCEGPLGAVAQQHHRDDALLGFAGEHIFERCADRRLRPVGLSGQLEAARRRT